MPVTLLMGAMVSIQCGAALAKGLFPLVGAVGTATMRIILAAAILALILRPWEKAASIRANIRSVILYGLCLGLMNISFYAAIDRIPLGVAVALEFTGPLGVAILSSRRPVDLIWVALATLGIVALARAPSSGESLDLYGVVLALLAGLFWGLYIISGERASREHGQQAVAIGMIVAALVALPIGLSQSGTAIFNMAALPLALAVALLSSALPYSLELVALRQLPRATFGILMSLEPLIATLAGYLLLREHLAPLQWGAIAAIATASAGAVWSAAQPPKLSEPL
ncbi:MAG: EamA family transporter [Sphingobium sp.]|nr:EamA family transporter [Sphingobium sp.]MCP5397861.1 EamA family transporter [Sphingomonas sp.]